MPDDVKRPPAVPEPSTGLPPVSTALTSAPILAHVVRCGVVESVHRGTLVVTGADGSVAEAWGDPSGGVFPRSALKPLQAVAMTEIGLALPPQLLALACASHSGEEFHLTGVLDILASAGLGVDALQNTPDFPIDDQEYDDWIRHERAASPLGHNCSGKHAAMLATTVGAGWDPRNYLDVDHPLQRAVTRTVERLTGAPVREIAVDGCGTPVHHVPLAGLSRAFGRLAAARDGTAEATVADAMRAHPEYLAGTRRDVTALMRAVPGLIVKDGAESVYAVGLPDGRGIALKIADGSSRAKPVVLAALLRRLGVGSEEIWSMLGTAPVLGHGRPVGAIVAVGV